MTDAKITRQSAKIARLELIRDSLKNLNITLTCTDDPYEIQANLAVYRQLAEAMGWKDVLVALNSQEYKAELRSLQSGYEAQLEPLLEKQRERQLKEFERRGLHAVNRSGGGGRGLDWNRLGLGKNSPRGGR